MNKASQRPSTTDTTGALPAGKTGKRRSPRLILLLFVGILLIGTSWWLRSSPWAHENALQASDLPQLEEAVRRQPEDFLARYYLAKRYYLEERFPDAQAAYAEAVRLDPKSARAHLGLGLALMEVGEAGRARTEFETALRYDPRLAWAEHMLGKIAWQRGNINDALPHALRATALDPRGHPAWYFLAVCYIQLQRYNEGVDALKQAIARFDGSAQYHTALGELLVYQGQTEEGRKHYARALEIDPNHGPACGLMGGFYLRKVPGLDALGRAQELLERATRLKTYHPNQIYFDLGELYLQQGEFQKAVEALKTSVGLDARDERPYFSLAKAYRRLGDKKAAVEAEAKFQAISKNHVQLQTMEARVFHAPNNAEARLQLARLYRDLGLDQKAATQYSVYMRLDPGATRVAEEFRQWLAKRPRVQRPTDLPDYVLPPPH